MSETKTFPVFYTFDGNRRVYKDDFGKEHRSPIFEKHFCKVEIIGENEKEFIVSNGRTINKRSMMLKGYSNDRHKLYTQKEKDDMVFIKEFGYPISKVISTLSADTLHKVKELLEQNNVPIETNNFLKHGFIYSSFKGKG